LRKNSNKNSSIKKPKPINATNKITYPEAYRNRLKARSNNQQKYIDDIIANHVTFAQGPAGSGKTLISVGMAIEYLLDDKVKKIIFTIPVVEVGASIGYLPGTAEEKLHPYLLPILDEIAYFISPAQYASLKLSNRIEVVPLNLMRGRTFNNSFIVCDESQNASYDQLKMLLTRIGKDSKMIINGDNMQSDLPRHAQGGLFTMTEQLCGIPGIGMSVLEISDIVRNPIISQIIIKLEEYEKQRTQ
jgi:phosphate starvation-inducible PhoH-like protein